MNKQDRNDLDNYITGHYGEDQMSPCEETEILLDRREKQLKRMITEARYIVRVRDQLYDSCDKEIDMVVHRETQLKRVIHSARERRKIADIRDEIIDILDAKNLRMVRALEDMTPGGSEFYWDFDRCLEFVQQKMESLQEIAKRKSAIPPVPPEVK